MDLGMLLQLAVIIQVTISATCAQVYSNLSTGFCRDSNGLYPNVYCRTAGYSTATCQMRCDSDLACVAFQVGIGLNTSCCIYGSATIDTAPPDWDFGYGNGGTDNITQAVSTDRVCFKRATCASNNDCGVALEGEVLACQDNLCKSIARASDDTITSNAWSTSFNLVLVAITAFAINT
eukprot:TRINITY_DN49289_c0_g1_i1.p1 TRINITY_DN49289_c0_g1~~TRINITY_DN49289_c0_g1_i1.p1  ORF type:complete len:178 (+),score=9.88 TRINITY_DN49289_c0_g1_i1:78-611(+)